MAELLQGALVFIAAVFCIALIVILGKRDR